MDSPPQSSQEEMIKSISYESTVAAKSPIPITIATSPSISATPSINGQRSPPALSPTSSMKAKVLPMTPSKSSIARVDSIASANSSHATPAAQRTGSVRSVTSVPQIRVEEHTSSPEKKEDKWWKHKKMDEEDAETSADTSGPSAAFEKIDLDIPSGGLDDFNADKIQFSTRGSMLLTGLMKANNNTAAAAGPINTINNGNNVKGHLRPNPTPRRSKSNPSLRVKAAQTKLLSVDEEMLSQKVRSFYDLGTDAIPDSDEHSVLSSQNNGTIWEESTLDPEAASGLSFSRTTSQTDVHSISSVGTQDTRKRGVSIKREENELAGGYEDWQDVQYEDVDRYGFIIPRSASKSGAPKEGIERSPSSVGHSLQRVSSSLQEVADAPRRKHTIRRQPSTAHSTRSMPRSSINVPRPTSSQSSYGRSLRGPHSKLRTATNKLPHNKSRKLLDEAGDMLTLPPELAKELDNGLVDIYDTPRMRRTEWAREEKWKRMAKAVPTGATGGGMMFEFDTTNPKLIERTWKGIPDRWRASAWHAFLDASAKKKNCISEEELLQVYEEYQEQSSPDDVQIDIDVPRTVGAHIMFRRRYRGGQRLLFRVLHAMSLHFPDTGYVQGMATLAATLLSYYDEERAFVMLVRLWELRGLEELYRHGFAGLMEALDDFEKGWLGNGEISTKLNSLNIFPTAYGTRWYLTLFNYSIPFSAQLRVWDVFMLLGDNTSPPPTTPTADGAKPSTFGTTLDVLHAASAALIAGTKDILLESDFENAMKVLTSWIPIRDDDIFMKVAKAEWKVHKRKVQG